MKSFILFAIVLFSYCTSIAQKKHPKVTKETTTEKGFLDKRTHENSEIIEFQFSDGMSGKLVKNNNIWYNYNIRGESSEVAYSSKEAGLQIIWESCKAAREAGAELGRAIGGASGKKTILKKDGTPDKRYKNN